jgi:glycosyltransferase involved in cell wall biosynthesis
MPPLEAMAVSCPTIVSKAAAMPEVCGAASEYVNPHDPADIARGIARVLNEPEYAFQLRCAGHERVAGFSWDETARIVAVAMEALVR